MTSDSETRVSLLERVRGSSNTEAWLEFEGMCAVLLNRWMTAQGVCGADADDVRQEVLSTVCEQLPKFQHNGRRGAFRSWLRMILVNRLRRFWRSKQRDPVRQAGPNLEELADQLTDEKGQLTLLWNRQHDQVVLSKLLLGISDRFEEKSMLAFRSVVLDQEPARDVAKRLGMSLGAVRVAQHRILRALQKAGKKILELENGE